MSFVTLGGSGEAPTFFEMVAAEKLMPSLKAAVMYSISILAQRRPSLNRLLDNEHELFFLTSVLLDRQSLWRHGASFAESVYSLKRIPREAADSEGANRAMSHTQRRMALILITLLPYIRAKLEALYHQYAQVPPPAGQHTNTREDQSRGVGVLRIKLLRAFIAAFPWLNASYEGARFSYQLLYLLGKIPYYSPSLHLLRLVVARMSSQEMTRADSEKHWERTQRAQRAETSAPLLRTLRRGVARGGEVLADHTRSALILAVFAFKLLEWWYSSAESKLGGTKGLPPPPPPPSIPPNPTGIDLPEDPAMCPLCRRKRTNPTMVVPSGYVYCYPCIHRHIDAQGWCPVTKVPAGLEQLRRLYQGM